MDSSRRAVEAYWRSRLIDAITSEEDKVAPVYKLEEVCKILRKSNVSVVMEVCEYILKRLDHKNPVVKKKALKLIKYAAGKSGIEFRREMQRHSVAMRQLFHYNGQVDPLKGDALNKAVRDTAHEAVSALFASEEKPITATENVTRRMEGFDSTDAEVQTEDRRSFLTEAVAVGSASIMQGLNNRVNGEMLMKDGGERYRSPNLLRSLTTINRTDTWSSSSGTNNLSRSLSLNAKEASAEISLNMIQSRSTGQTPEERLLDNIVTPGGVRLRPTRVSIHSFLKEAEKLDALSLCFAMESKLQSHVWQVRMKAACVLEAILQKKDGDFFAFMASYFSGNKESIVKCSETPQASVRQKANDVLALLYENHPVEGKAMDAASNDKVSYVDPVQLLDLIDTDEIDPREKEGPPENPNDECFSNHRSVSLAIDDHFEGGLVRGSTENNTNIGGDDPFSGMSFHTNEIAAAENVDDLFSGLVVGDNQSDIQVNKSMKENLFGSFNIFGNNFPEVSKDSHGDNIDFDDLVYGLSDQCDGTGHRMRGIAVGAPTGSMSSVPSNHSQAPSGQNNILNWNTQIPVGSIQYSFPANGLLNQAFASQRVNNSTMRNLAPQLQLLSEISNHQPLGSFGNQENVGRTDAYVRKDSGYSSALPDIFQAQSFHVQSHTVVTEISKKANSSAFDFIMDHMSAARDPKSIF